MLNAVLMVVQWSAERTVKVFVGVEETVVDV